MLADKMDSILLITGLATAGALTLSLAPVRMSNLIFGRPPADELGLVIARHWGLLVGLVGALIVYSAYHAEVRVPTLLVAIAEKAAFALGIFLLPFRRRPMVLALALADAGMSAIYLSYYPGKEDSHRS